MNHKRYLSFFLPLFLAACSTEPYFYPETTYDFERNESYWRHHAQQEQLAHEINRYQHELAQINIDRQIHDQTMLIRHEQRQQAISTYLLHLQQIQNEHRAEIAMHSPPMPPAGMPHPMMPPPMTHPPYPPLWHSRPLPLPPAAIHAEHHFSPIPPSVAAARPVPVPSHFVPHPFMPAHPAFSPFPHHPDISSHVTFHPPAFHHPDPHPPAFHHPMHPPSFPGWKH